MMDYLELLDRLHAALRPRAYLEIGVEFGTSLRLSRTRSIAIDPDPRAGPEAFLGKPWLKLYRESSNDFFRNHTAEATLEGQPLDLAFIDGLHKFVQVVRDIEHVERWSHPGTVIVVHDVLPQNAWQATRAFHEGPWTGDVWRIVPFLREHRPDLRCDLVDVSETGALVITGLSAGHSSVAKLAKELDRDFPPDSPEYELLVESWLASARPEQPEALLRALCPTPRSVNHRLEGEGWVEGPGGWVVGEGITEGSLRIVLDEPIQGGHRANLKLTARGMQVLRIQVHYVGPGGARCRNVFLDVTHPGALFHGLDSLWLDADPQTGSSELDWEGLLAPGESLTEITLDPLDFWLQETGPATGMTIDLQHIEFQQIPWPRLGTRFAPERFPDRPKAPKRRDGKRDAVVYAWWVPDTPEAYKVGEYYLGLLRYHHPDSKVFVGVNHGSDPAWIGLLEASGLDIEIAAVDPAIQVTSDVGGFLAALGAFARYPEEFDLVWFGHTKGASRTTFEDDEDRWYNCYRYQHNRKLWARRSDIDAFFADPKIGLFAYRYGLHDPSEDAPWRGFVELDALHRVYRDTCAPLGLWAWETVFVMRDIIVRHFCEAVGEEFFRTNPPEYGAGRWWFEAAFPSIASMQGYEPLIELDTDTWGSLRDDVVMYVDPGQGNRIAMAELRRWRENPFMFQPRALPRF